MVFLLLNIAHIVERAISYFVLKISVKRVSMILWWLRTFLFFCNNVPKSLMWSVNTTLNVRSCILFIMMFGVLE